MAMITPERDLEESLVTKLRDLKYEYRPDIRDRAKLEANFREKFEPLNRVNLTDGEFQRLLDEIVTPDVYEAARELRDSLERDMTRAEVSRATELARVCMTSDYQDCEP